MSGGDDKGINWVQVAAAALAAVSSAVLLSTLGVAGTVIGAALGSVTASVGSALYGRTLDASRQQVAAQAAALKRVAQARAQVDQARLRGPDDTGLQRAAQDLSEAEEALEQVSPHDAHDPNGADEPDRSVDDSLAGGSVAATPSRQIPWKRVALIAAGVFIAVMVAITGFEMLTGRAVSVYTGGSDPSTGSTVPGLANDRKNDKRPDMAPDEQPTRAPAPEDGEEPKEPAESPTPSEPVSTPSEEPTETSEPTPVPSVTASPTDGVG